jgi:hypothetical protein
LPATGPERHPIQPTVVRLEPDSRSDRSHHRHLGDLGAIDRNVAEQLDFAASYARMAAIKHEFRHGP